MVGELKVLHSKLKSTADYYVPNFGTYYEFMSDRLRLSDETIKASLEGEICENKVRIIKEKTS